MDREDGSDAMFFDIGSGEAIAIVTVLGLAGLGVRALVRSFRRPRV